MKKLLLLLAVIPLLVWCQDRKEKSRIATITSLGLQVGQSDTRPVLHLSGGLDYHRFFTGIGTGYDTYEFNSVPVFADWRWRFGKKQTGFIYGMGGYHFPLSQDQGREWGMTGDRLKGGLYLDAGAGYRMPLGSLNRLSLSAGYSYKRMSHEKIYVFPCFTGDCPENVRRYNYSFARLVAKISWELKY